LWGEPFFVGEAQEKQTNKQTNKKQKTKHFFSFLKRRTPYVIRMKEIVALLLTQQSEASKQQPRKDGAEDE
jgi:hypothetical protein